MKKIELSQGKHALVDDDDFDFLTQWNWYYHKKADDRIGYAVRNEPRKNGTRISPKMHRVVIKARPREIVDHINGDSLDNRKSNLRIVTTFQSAWNKPVSRVNKSCGLKGVSFVRDKKGTPKYCIARITKYGKRKYLGVFKTPEEASEAYFEAAKEMHKEFACK